QFLLRLLQVEGELRRRLAVAGGQVSLDPSLQVADLGAVRVHLAGDAIDQGPVLFESLAPLLDLLDGRVVLVLHLGDRVRGPEDVGDLVQLRPQRTPELAEDHRCTDLSLPIKRMQEPRAIVRNGVEPLVSYRWPSGIQSPPLYIRARTLSIS